MSTRTFLHLQTPLVARYSAMPLTLAQLKDIQADALADDIDIELERMQHWTLEEATKFFESGGQDAPSAAGTHDVAATPPTARVITDANRRRERFAGDWLVADMDSTLIRKDRGVYGSLDDSPCRAPLLEWLRSGGSLLVVTSDDGWRPFEQLWKQIPSELRVRVAMSTSDGAALFRGDTHGRPQEDERYWRLAKGGIKEEAVEPLVAVARDMYCRMLNDCLAKPARREELLRLLSSKDAAAIGALLD